MQQYLKNILKYFEVKDYEVILYRWWGIIVGFFVPIYGILLLYFLEESIERIDHRLLISVMYAVIISASFFSHGFKKHLPLFILIADLISISWITWIVIVNRFSPEYSIGLFLCFCCVAAIRRDLVEMVLYSLFFAIILGIAFYITPQTIINTGAYCLSIFIVISVNLLVFARRQYENNKLKSLNKDLEQKNEELERYFYVASHDLKSPLRTIGSFASLMKRRLGKEVSDEIKEYMDFILTGAKRMTAVIDDLLRYARNDFDKEELEKVNIVELIEMIWGKLTVDLEAVELNYSKNIPPFIVADANQMEQLFQNLIENGLKYNRSQTKKISIKYQEKAAYHVFSVSDNGIGMDMKYKHKVFEMFQRLHTNDEFEGTGIGLAICKRIVENHKGSISIKSFHTGETTDGTTFEWTIAKKL